MASSFGSGKFTTACVITTNADPIQDSTVLVGTALEALSWSLNFKVSKTSLLCLRIEAAESSSRNIDTSNMHTFYQRHRSDYHLTKNHPLEQVYGNSSKHVQTRRQLATDLEMYMFVLIVGKAKPKNIKEAMDDHAWIDAIQEELHQFDKLNVWELVDKPFGKKMINLKWLWKNKKDEDNTVIQNKSRLVAKGYC
nr:Gag-Pol polyprotein [Tanacetum cinerariifolium]